MFYITLNSFMFMDYTKVILNVILSIIAFLLLLAACAVLFELFRMA